MGGPMRTKTGSWLAAHGKLWYDDPWYRTAWIVWPQAVGLALFVSLWLFPAAKEPVAQQHQPVDVLAPCSKVGGYPERIQACTSLLASGNLKGSDVPNAYWYRGWAYVATKQYQLAANDYSQAIALSPNSGDFYNARAEQWMELGNNDRAMQDLDQAIRLKPDFAAAFTNRGIVLRRLKRQDEALVALSKAIELAPTLRVALEHRASIYEDRSDWRAVLDDSNKMIALQPDNRLGYEYRGHAYFGLGQYQPAIADFSK